MKRQFIQIAMATGHIYELPITVVGVNRAHAMFKLHPDEFPTLEAAIEDTAELFNDDLSEVRDWAQNNMNWKPDLEPHARLIRFTPPDLVESLQTAEFTYHDHRAITGELDGADVMRAPLELLANVMTESQQLCNVVVLNAADGQPFGAVAVIVGTPAIVSAYINTLKFTGDQLTAGQPAAPTH